MKRSLSSKSRSIRCRHKGRPRRAVPGTLPDDLYDYIHERRPRRSARLRVVDMETLRVVDDWPQKVPITEAEIVVFERWFADVFDELFGPNEPQEGLCILSFDDKDTQ